MINTQQSCVIPWFLWMKITGFFQKPFQATPVKTSLITKLYLNNSNKDPTIGHDLVSNTMWFNYWSLEDLDTIL